MPTSSDQWDDNFTERQNKTIHSKPFEIGTILKLTVFYPMHVHLCGTHTCTVLAECAVCLLLHICFSCPYSRLISSGSLPVWTVHRSVAANFLLQSECTWRWTGRVINSPVVILHIAEQEFCQEDDLTQCENMFKEYLHILVSVCVFGIIYCHIH